MRWEIKILDMFELTFYDRRDFEVIGLKVKVVSVDYDILKAIHVISNMTIEINDDIYDLGIYSEPCFYVILRPVRRQDYFNGILFDLNGEDDFINYLKEIGVYDIYMWLQTQFDDNEILVITCKDFLTDELINAIRESVIETVDYVYNYNTPENSINFSDSL